MCFVVKILIGLLRRQEVNVWKPISGPHTAGKWRALKVSWIFRNIASANRYRCFHNSITNSSFHLPDSFLCHTNQSCTGSGSGIQHCWEAKLPNMGFLTEVSPGAHGEGFPCRVEEVEGVPVTVSKQAFKKNPNSGDVFSARLVYSIASETLPQSSSPQRPRRGC